MIRDTILQLYQQNPKRLLKDIAQQAATSERYVSYVLNSLGIKRRDYTPPNRLRLPRSQITAVLSRYTAGESCNDIARDVGLAVASVNRIVRENGGSLRVATECHTIYPATDIFAQLNERSAYFLGLLYADGNVNGGRNMVSISLVDSERPLLEALSLAVYGSIRLTPIRPKRATHSPASRLTIYNDRIKASLVRLGCGPKKSLTLTFPEIPKDLVRHFVRGYFDGDGGVSVRRNHAVGVGIVGTKAFLDHAAGLLAEAGVVCAVYRHSAIWKLAFASKAAILAFYRYLYTGGTIWSQRKETRLRDFLVSRFGAVSSWPPGQIPENEVKDSFHVWN